MVRKKFSSHIISFIFKSLCALVIIAVLGILAWRFIASANPYSMKRIIPNKALCQAYVEHEKISVFTQDQDNITRGDKSYGYFSVTEAKFYEEAEQVQIIFRYNDSTLRHLCEDYGLDQAPAKESEVYDVTLTIAYDLTPNDTTDNAGNNPESVRFERVHATRSASDSKAIYNFRKFVFDGVKIDDSVLAVYVDVYYNQDINYDEEAYGTLIIYDYKTKKEYSSLSGQDKDTLERWTDFFCGE